MIKIYDKYIFKQVLLTTFVAILLFTVVWIAPEMLLNTIKKTLSGAYTVKMAVLVILYELPKILGKALPVGLLLGTIFTFDKLSKDSELTIFRAVGMSFLRIIAPVIVFSIIVTVFCFIVYDKLIPYACAQNERIHGGAETIQYIYTQKDENDHPQKTIIVSRFLKDKMKNVIVLDFSNKVYSDLHGLNRIYVANTGRYANKKWILSDIKVFNMFNDERFESISSLDEMPILDGVEGEEAYILLTYSAKRDREITNKDLRHYIKLLKKNQLEEEYRFMLNKYYQRFLHPLVCILFAVMGCLLGFSKPREQRLIGFTIAIACIFLYYITLPFFDLLAEKNVLPPLITAAFPPVAFLCCIFAFYKSKEL